MCVEKNNFDMILKAKDQAPNLKNIVCYDDDLAEEKVKKAQDMGINVYFFSEVVQKGKDCTQEIVFREPTPESVLIFCYTSGTTGDPKAGML